MKTRFNVGSRSVRARARSRRFVEALSDAWFAEPGPGKLSLHDSFGVAIAMAAALSLLVLAIGAIAGVVHWARHGWTDLVAVAPPSAAAGAVVIASYFGAAVVGAPVFYVLSPVSDRWWGQSLLATALGFVIYGTVGLSLVLAYTRLGVNVLDYESHAAAWRMLPSSTIALAVMTGVLGPPIWRLQRERFGAIGS